MKINICSNASPPNNLQYSFSVIFSPVSGIVLKKKQIWNWKFISQSKPEICVAQKKIFNSNSYQQKVLS